MSKKDEALKLALEALEAVTKEMLAIRDEIAERGGRPKTNAFHQRLWDSSFAAYTDKAIPAAEAIREALAEQPAQQRHISYVCPQCYWSLDEQPAQQQEPIGDDWTPCIKLPVIVHVRQQRKGETHVSTREGITPVKPDDLIMRGVSGEEYPIGRAIFEQTYSFDTSPQPAQQQPVATVTSESGNPNVSMSWWHEPALPVGTKLYTSPPASKPWAGLTEQERNDLEDYCEMIIGKAAFQAIEAKLREKNAS